MVSFTTVDEKSLLVIKCPKRVDLSYTINVLSQIYDSKPEYRTYHVFVDLSDLDELQVNLKAISGAINLYSSRKAAGKNAKSALLVPTEFKTAIQNAQAAYAETNYEQLVSDSLEECAAFLGVDQNVLLQD